MDPNNTLLVHRPGLQMLQLMVEQSCGAQAPGCQAFKCKMSCSVACVLAFCKIVGCEMVQQTLHNTHLQFCVLQCVKLLPFCEGMVLGSFV